MIDEADRILAPTPIEASQLVGLYRADPDQMRLVPPGVDHVLFVPGDRARARERLAPVGTASRAVRGRLQPHKGPDVAVRTLAEARRPRPRCRRRPGARDRRARSERARQGRRGRAAAGAGVGARCERPGRCCSRRNRKSKLADFYAAADVVLVPSRSESFGLVALEAQACGTPVVAADVGGLPLRGEDGRTGFLVEGHDPGDHADRLLQILQRRRAAVGAWAPKPPTQAPRFTWDATADAVLGVYRRGARREPRAMTPVRTRRDLRVHRSAVTSSRSRSRFVTLFPEPLTCRYHALTCGNEKLTAAAVRPYVFASLQAVEVPTRGDRTRRRTRRKAGKEPEDRRRPQGQKRTTGSRRRAARPERRSGHADAARSKRVPAGSAASWAGQGSPAAAGAPQGEPAGGRRLERLRASRRRAVGHRRDGAEVAWGT